MSEIIRCLPVALADVTATAHCRIEALLAVEAGAPVKPLAEMQPVLCSEDVLAGKANATTCPSSGAGGWVGDAYTYAMRVGLASRDWWTEATGGCSRHGLVLRSA